jgi:nitrate reductase NapE component
LSGWISTAFALVPEMNSKYSSTGMNIIGCLIILVDGAVVGPFGFIIWAWAANERRKHKDAA